MEDIAIGEFVRREEIGKGSFAAVYRATHRVRGLRFHSTLRPLDISSFAHHLLSALNVFVY